MSKPGFCPVTRRVFETVADVCAEHGLDRPKLVTGGKHMKCRIVIDGKAHHVPLPISPRSGAEHASRMKACDVRRLIKKVRGAA